MSQVKTHVKKGDQVKVITGNHKGKQGTVLHVNAAKGRVIVEGVRQVKKATRATETSEGGIQTIDGPIHISNVKKVG